MRQGTTQLQNSQMSQSIVLLMILLSEKNLMVRTQLHIVDDTGDWLVVSNGTDLLLLSLNISDCEDSYNPDIAIYILKTLVNCFNVLLATCIIVLHLCIKEL